jgi:ferredoxin-NADP reductase
VTLFDPARPWRDSEPLLLTRVVREAPDVGTFVFRAPEPAWFRYLPGQFVTLELPMPGRTVLRTYTLSSSPSRPLSVSVTAKAQPGSVATRWMFDHLKPGGRVRALGPAGVFSCALHPSRKYLFVAAGSGITPMLSMARWLDDTGADADVLVVAAARTPADLLFRAELETMAARSDRLRVAFAVTQPDGGWSGYAGRVSAPMLRLMAPDLAEREVFCCGPAPFMATVRAAFLDAGGNEQTYHEEAFHPVEAEAPAVPSAAARVRFTLADLDVDAGADETILQIARGAGLNIPSGCTMGLCGTCKVRCLEGRTDMRHQGGIMDDEIAEGFVLACCTRPLGRVAIEA